MDKLQAQRIVQEILGAPFDKSAFIKLTKELFNEIDETKAFHARGYVPEAYKKYVKTYERLATYTDPDDLKIDILIVYLQNETTLERARTSQRNFIAHYLKDRGQKDAGLVAFVSPDLTDWRFSLVKMDYKIDEKGKVKDDFTPARRWSFLVGANENSHTARSRLAPLILDDTHNPTLAELEEAFNIETVTKEFFTEYRDLFIRVKEALDHIVNADLKIKNNFTQNGVNTVDFAKKLLGQIIFLYFLQKKGWFGVGRDADWGTGSKQFLRELFEEKHGSYKNFFNDILEPLFYDALRIDRSHDDHYYSRFNCKIPFLNGGLFDPMNNYDWVHTDILIPNELFSNKHKTAKGDTGSGILDIFDRYNFTVKEDEPLEKEVAIDPELLGKAYEKFNAIRPDNFAEYQKALKSSKKGEESKFNKQFGVYYTPREIVHYMCQQSLINYLHNEFNGGMTTYEKPGIKQTDLLGNVGKSGQLDLTIEHKEKPAIPKDDIEKLIHYGERITEIEAIAVAKEENISAGKQKSTKAKSFLSESIRSNAQKIDEKLSSIKVCDPAIGSGAFPVGMMNEIVRARNVLSNFIKGNDRSSYRFKRECIENSLYGVDIDSGAVEIAKLRLWLSLVVDEDDIKQIKPLPNLDYKVVCGNSLIGFPAGWDSPAAKEIESLKHDYFSATNPTRKKELKKIIDSKIDDRYKNSLKTFGYDIKFDFRTAFSEVFHEKGGFDVIIANPPYVLGRETFSKELKQYIKKNYHAFGGKYDLYIYFTEKAISLLKTSGTVTYIIPNTILANENAARLRKLILDKTQLNIIRVFDKMIFFEAQVESVIIEICNKQPTEEMVTVQTGRIIQEVHQNVFGKNKDFRFNIYSSSTTESLIDKIIKQSEPLGNLSDICIGIQLGGSSGHDTKDDFISNIQKNRTFKKVLDGKDINFYSTEWYCKYVRYGNWLHRKRDEKYFLNLKIMIRQIGAVPVATYDEEGYYTLNTIYNLINSSDYSLKYFLAIINSNLGKWFWRSQNSDFKTLFPKIKKAQIESIPIRRIVSTNPSDKCIHDKIVSLVDCILLAKNADPEGDTSKLERKIDQTIYSLYGLTPDEIAIVEGKAAE
ncbi:MAG: N-6 DNA methylase [Prolixibacteraceae bacterium]|nr:N-6 DNA methylase [Prolixibacteraceae bacterium]